MQAPDRPEPPMDLPPAIAQSSVVANDVNVSHTALDATLVEQWPEFAAQLPVTGMAQQLATQSACLSVSGDMVSLKVATQALAEGAHVKRLTEVLSEWFARPVRLQVQIGDLAQVRTAQSIADDQAAEQQRQAEEIVRDDPFVNALIEGFGAQVLPGSVRAVQGTGH